MTPLSIALTTGLSSRRNAVIAAAAIAVKAADASGAVKEVRAAKAVPDNGADVKAAKAVRADPDNGAGVKADKAARVVKVAAVLAVWPADSIRKLSREI